MRNIIKRLAGWVFVRLGGDLTDLTRKANHLLTSKDHGEEPSGPEREQFLQAMATLADSNELRWLMEEIGSNQKRLTFEQARDLNELNWGRATQNGMMLLHDRLAGYKTEFVDTKKRNEAFDPYRPI